MIGPPTEMYHVLMLSNWIFLNKIQRAIIYLFTNCDSDSLGQNIDFTSK